MTVTKKYCDRCVKEVIYPVERRLYLSGIGREGGYDLCNSCYEELVSWFIEKVTNREEGNVNECKAESKETEKGNKIS